MLQPCWISLMGVLKSFLLFYSPSISPSLSALPKVWTLPSWCSKWTCLDSSNLTQGPVSTFIFVFRISTPSEGASPQIDKVQTPQNKDTLWGADRHSWPQPGDQRGAPAILRFSPSSYASYTGQTFLMLVTMASHYRTSIFFVKMLPPSRKSEARENKWLKGSSVSQLGIFAFIYKWERWCSKRWMNHLSKITELVRNLVRIWTQVLNFLTAVSCCSVAQSCPTLCDPMAACQASLFFIISQSLLKLMSIELVMPSNHFILCLPLFLLPSVLPSIRVFSGDSFTFSHEVAKVLEFQLQHQSFQ